MCISELQYNQYGSLHNRDLSRQQGHSFRSFEELRRMSQILNLAAKHSQVVAGVGLAALFAGTLYPQTLGLNSYKRIVAQYKDGEEQPLDETTKDLSQKVLEQCNLTPEEEVSISFFTNFGQDPVHVGSSKLRSGAYIGLPATFAYTATNQVQTEQMQINNAPIEWDSPQGKLLLQSIVLSEDAKKFAVAREINYANTHHVFIEAFIRFGFGYAAYASGFCLNHLFQLKRVLKRWSRLCIYATIGCIFYGLYTLMDDTYYCYRDLKVDTRAADMGQDYAKGGVEFYTKILQRNAALRSILGSEGEQIYTKYGNLTATWRRPHATLSERRDALQKKLKKENLDSQ